MGSARTRAISGVTLVELLIAMAISTLIIGLATFSFSLFTRDWKGRTTGFDREAAQAQRLDLLTGALDAAVPWVVRGQRGRYGYYFLGRPEGLTLVSADPVFGGGAPAVIRVFRENDPDGKLQLVYEQASLAGMILSEADQILPFKNRMVVVKGLRKIEFRYYGWESMLDRVNVDADSGRKPVWTTEFDGLRRMEHPLRVALDIDDGEAVFFMPERAGIQAE